MFHTTLEDKFWPPAAVAVMCKVCYMQTVDISEIYPQQVYQARGISEEAKVT